MHQRKKSHVSSGKANNTRQKISSAAYRKTTTMHMLRLCNSQLHICSFGNTNIPKWQRACTCDAEAPKLGNREYRSIGSWGYLASDPIVVKRWSRTPISRSTFFFYNDAKKTYKHIVIDLSGVVYCHFLFQQFWTSLQFFALLQIQIFRRAPIFGPTLILYNPGPRKK